MGIYTVNDDRHPPLVPFGLAMLENMFALKVYGGKPQICNFRKNRKKLKNDLN